MSDAGLSIEVADDPAEADAAEIERKLSAYNVRMAERPYDRKPLAVFLRDGDALVGGLTGHTNWGWLYVDCFWLSEELRGGGWGSRLLHAAESAACLTWAAPGARAPPRRRDRWTVPAGAGTGRLR